MADIDRISPHPVGAGTFTRFAQAFAKLAGRPITVISAGAVILIWIAVGPLYHFSETWLLAINTATTVVTFLMVFLIQHTQTRDTAAIQLKLSEILLTMEGAASRIAAVEHESDEELALLQEQYRKKSANTDPETQRGSPVMTKQSKPKDRNRETEKDRARDKDDQATPRDDDRDRTVPDDQKHAG
jgi:low affinity Fe/Cu permease